MSEIEEKAREEEEAHQDDAVDQDADQAEQGDGEEAPAEGGKRKRKRKRKKKVQETEKTKENEQSERLDLDPVECTVYVEGIPFDSKPDQVREFFVSNDVSEVLELRLPTWQDSGRLRGYGHVLFGSKKSYEKALALSGKHLGKRYLTIEPANTPKNGGSQSSVPDSDEPPPKDCQTLFVTNLPYGATEEEISNVFEKHGEIAEDGVRIARNSVTRQSKGFCYIDFCSPKDAQNVVQAATKKNLSVTGRVVRLDYDTGRMKGSYRAESGRLWAKETKDKEKSKRHRSN
jgi:nucleolin